MLSGCPLEGDSGKDGVNGINGVDGVDGGDGADGADGINCWDTNGDGINDASEDTNSDGVWDTKDCLPKSKPEQNPQVELNHQHICEAFANLGQYPEGCPSAVHSNPSGTLQRITALLADGLGNGVNCDYPPNNGLLSAKPKGNEYFWHLEGGFIADVTTIEAVDELENNTCFTICQADSKCIASWAELQDAPGTAYKCHLFYHSDTVPAWTHRCGLAYADCARRTGALSTAQRWSTICP